MADFTDKLLCAIGAHDWTKWEQYDWHGVRYYRYSDPIDIIVHRQKRTCRVCGKVRDERIY